MAKITIIVEDNTVVKNGVSHEGLDLSSCRIPSNVSALQWDNTAGEIEFDTAIENEVITELPTWATACEALWQQKEYSRQEARKKETEEDPVETFWDAYPEASAVSVNKILAKQYKGIVNEKALDTNNVLKGIQTTSVADDPTALASLATFKNDCIALGVPPMSDKMAESVPSTFIKYMTDTLGYTLYTPTNRVYWPWAGDIVSNKRDQDIDAAREESLKAGVEWNGSIWQIDLDSRNNIMNMLVAIISGVYTDTTVTWRNKANVDVELTVEEFKQLAAAVNAKVEEIYLASFADKA